MQNFYEKSWSKDDIHVISFIHQLYQFRYHWHENEYEIDLLLRGQAQYIRETERYTLNPGDIIIINPGTGHASYSLKPGSIACVLRISAGAFDRFLNVCERFFFHAFPENETTRKKIVYYALTLLEKLNAAPSVLQETRSRALLDLITSLIAGEVPSEIIRYEKEDLYRLKVVRTITSYMEEHYPDKISLEQMAALTKYNRTYISTIFRKSIGIRFYDYLTRIRLQNALDEIYDQRKSLTSIALSNGFPDLKNFNRKFREVLGMSPSEYRKIADPVTLRQRNFLNPDDPAAKELLGKYLDIFGGKNEGRFIPVLPPDRYLPV